MKSSTIKHAIIYNVFLIAYFMTSNLTTFFGSVLLLAIVIAPEMLSKKLDQCQKKQCSENSCCSYAYLNKKFNQFLQLDLLDQIVVTALVKVSGDVLYYVPSWLLIILIVEFLVVKDELADMGIMTKISETEQLVQQKCNMVIDMVPKHKA